MRLKRSMSNREQIHGVIIALLVMLLTNRVGTAVEVSGKLLAADSAGRWITIEQAKGDSKKPVTLDVAPGVLNGHEFSTDTLLNLQYDPEGEMVTAVQLVETAFDTAAFLKELEALQGEWSHTNSVVGGKEVESERLKTQRHRLQISGNTMVFLASLPSREVRNERAFVIDPSKHHITLWWRDSDGRLNQGVGIYALSGDELSICYAYNQDGKTSRPDEFVSVQGPPPNAFHTFKRSR
jgi:uncharacterized protein (TIGR03067 family)